MKYKKEFDQYLLKINSPYKAIVAFSGEIDGQSEANLNGFSSALIPSEFEKNEYRFLIVANKYQTGFDQPLLHTMYVDKKLQGVLAVQALSRLNRSADKLGKKTEDLFILDFYNSTEDIKKAFDPFYTSTSLSQATDVNVLHELKAQLDDTGVYEWQEVEDFVAKYFEGVNAQELSPIIDVAADRFNAALELEDQAWKAFNAYLKNDYSTVIYKDRRDDWRKAEIVVTTVQSLLFNGKYQRLFSPTDFDLVISDEAHRSIGGNARAVFEYFVGYKLGLTATPKDYLRNFDASTPTTRDPREQERRLLLDTYRTFGCEGGQPTFRYSLLDGVRDNVLVNPLVVDARTDITTQLLSDQGYAVTTPVGESGQQDQVFVHTSFEKSFFSDATNRVFCDTFVAHALRDPVSGEIGKSIVFAVSQNHAAKLTQILNELADRLFPGKYQSDFAVQVTSSVPGAQQFTINFANNNLLGSANFLDSYKTSKARVCVTVGMMTTGYDCSDILNLALMRPVFSPSDFVQIKGRGTRKHDFLDLLLDDAAPARQGDEIQGASIDQATLAVTELGRVQGPLLGDPDLAAAAWLNQGAPVNQDLIAALYTGFLDRYGATMTDDQKNVCERWVESFDAFMATESEGHRPTGLVHGDYRLDNMLFGEPGAERPLTIVDWQTVTWGPAMTDLAYFLGCALPTAMRRTHFDSLVSAYHAALGPQNPLQLADVREGVRRGSFMGVTMTIIASMVVERTERGDRMFLTMLDRNCAQVLDTDALAVLA